MNSKRTLILLALVAGMLGFIILFERQGNEEATTVGKTARLFANFNPSSASAVEIVLRTNRIIRAERVHDDWMLKMPIQYPANAARIDGLLNALSLLNRQSHITAQELLSQKQNLAAFGLDPPLASIIVELPHERVELKVGGKSPVGNQVYVQLVGSDGIFFTDALLHERIPQQPDDWRDPTFLRLRGLTFNRLEVVSKAGDVELQIDPSTQLWRLTKPMNARADNQKIAQLIRLLEDWPIARFLPESMTPDFDALGLQTPEASLMVGQGTNDIFVVHFGKSPTNEAGLVYARSLPQTNVMLVPRDVLTRLQAPFIELREPHMISTPITAVDLIEVKSQESFTLRKMADNSWAIAGATTVPADEELMKNFLADLASLRITSYVKDVVTDFSAYGLDSPGRQYTLRRIMTNTVSGVVNPILAQINFGTNNADQIYARLSNETSVYSTKWVDSWKLPTQAYQLRYRQIWNFTTNDVSNLTINFQGRTNKLVRNAARQWTLAPDPTPLGGPLTNLVDEVLFRLGQLRAESWTASGDDQMARFGFPTPRHQITVEVGVTNQAQSLSLDFGGESPTQNMYGAILRDGQRLIFEFRMPVYLLYSEILRQLSVPPANKPPKS